MTVIVTDARYRMAAAAIRSLGEAGYSVVAVERDTYRGEVFSFESKYVTEKRYLDAENYISELLSLAKEKSPCVIFPTGAYTLDILSCDENRTEFEKYAFFTVSPKCILDTVNDKEKVSKAAERLSVKVPYTYGKDEKIKDFPVVVKPHCGEKFGLRAADRYDIVNNSEEYEKSCAKMIKYGGDPIVQEYISGHGIGVSLLMGRDGRAKSALCHRRIREYPTSGGPSSCCESFYDEGLVRQSERLLSSMGFYGMAMAEYKCCGKIGEESVDNSYLLEINPRVWGSFPLTYTVGSSFAADYARLSAGEDISTPLDAYKKGARMSFYVSDLAACASYIMNGKIKTGLTGIFCDIIGSGARDGLYERGDRGPFFSYLKLKLFGGGRK